MIDRLTDKFYWPALVGAWVGVAVVASIILFDEAARVLTYPTQMGLAALCATAFIVMLLDRKTRNAVNSYNFYIRDNRDELKARQKELGWIRTFCRSDPDFPDPPLQRTLRAAWITGVITMFIGNKPASLIAFESFFLVGIMLMMRMKRGRWGAEWKEGAA